MSEHVTCPTCKQSVAREVALFTSVTVECYYMYCPDAMDVPAEQLVSDYEINPSDFEPLDNERMER